MAESEPVTTPPETVVAPVNALELFTRPALRLSRRQKEILGICGKGGPPTEKQKLRNLAAGNRLKKYHEERRAQRKAQECDVTRDIEEKANVKIVEQQKRARVSVKKRPVVEPSSISSAESDSGEADESSVPLPKIPKRSKQSVPDVQAAYVNPYLGLFR